MTTPQNQSDRTPEATYISSVNTVCGAKFSRNLDKAWRADASTPVKDQRNAPQAKPQRRKGPIASADRIHRDTVTILWTEPGKLATKQFTKTSPEATIAVEPYDAGYLFTAFDPVGVNNIEELSAVLQFVENHSRALIIRGAPVTGEVIGPWVNRTGSDHGNDFVGNFETPRGGRRYLEIDVDKFVLPSGLVLRKGSVGKICEHLIHQLPAEFHGATYHWQLSSSAGVFDRSKVSAHLWFWLVKAVPDAQLKAWAQRVNQNVGYKLVDTALFQHVQPHYTAAPIFKGMTDPFPVRSGLARKSMDSVDLQLPAPEPAKPTSLERSAGDPDARNAGNGAGFENILNNIGDHPGGNGFRVPLLRASASYVAAHGRENTNAETLYGLLAKSVLAADSRHHTKSEVTERASREFIMPLIETAMTKFGDAKSQRRKSRRIEDVPAHFTAVTEEVGANKEPRPKGRGIRRRQADDLRVACGTRCPGS